MFGNAIDKTIWYVLQDSANKCKVDAVGKQTCPVGGQRKYGMGQEKKVPSQKSERQHIKQII